MKKFLTLKHINQKLYYDEYDKKISFTVHGDPNSDVEIISYGDSHGVNKEGLGRKLKLKILNFLMLH